jgi:xylitol oxidase
MPGVYTGTVSDFRSRNGLMDKREFLKGAGAALSGSFLSSLLPAQTHPQPRTNWSGNLTYSTDRLYQAASVEEVQALVRKCPHLKALGSRHSFNNIADSTENQVSLQGLKTVHLDAAARTVTVGAGIRYGDLAPVINAQGYALHNLASLPHISVAGAIATATHGSGLHNGNLATAVAGLEMVSANGEVVRLSRAQDADRFRGAVVHLGALGILTHITLDVQPTYQVAQTVYLDLPFAVLEHHLEEVFASGYSVSLFTDWQKGRATQVWIKRRTDRTDSHALGAEFFGARRATVKMHPIIGHDAEACTEQLGIPGPWYERLPHFRMNFTPSSGQELQTEYFVPLERGYEAIRAVEELRDAITPHLFVTEFRTIDADELWMSTAHRRRSLTLHFTWKPEWPAVKQILPQIEAKLKPFNVRPHWGKLFTLSPEYLEARYERLADFEGLAREYDTGGKFRNAFLNHNLYGS